MSDSLDYPVKITEGECDSLDYSIPKFDNGDN